MAGRPVLVPLDGSALAEGAITYARAIARATEAELVFFSAFRQVEMETPEHHLQLEEDARAHFTSYLEDVRQRGAYSNSRIALAFGRPADEIVRTAQRMNAAMVVMASHGRSGVGRWTHGSTTWSVVHETESPVMVVNHSALAPVGAQVTFTHVLVPLDGSSLAETALPVAASLVRTFGAQVSLARVVQPAQEAYPAMVPPMRYMAEVDEENALAARRYLESCEGAFVPPVKVTHEVLEGAAADELLRIVESSDVDLVVLATHARSGFGRTTLGSVADRMLHATVPVVVVPPPH